MESEEQYGEFTSPINRTRSFMERAPSGKLLTLNAPANAEIFNTATATLPCHCPCHCLFVQLRLHILRIGDFFFSMYTRISNSYYVLFSVDAGFFDREIVTPPAYYQWTRDFPLAALKTFFHPFPAFRHTFSRNSMFSSNIAHSQWVFGVLNLAHAFSSPYTYCRPSSTAMMWLFRGDWSLSRAEGVDEDIMAEHLQPSWGPFLVQPAADALRRSLTRNSRYSHNYPSIDQISESCHLQST